MPLRVCAAQHKAQFLQEQLGPRGLPYVDRISEHRLGMQISSTIAAGQNERHNHGTEDFRDWGDPFPCEVDVKNGSVWTLGPQQSQCCTDIVCRADHLIPGIPQRVVQLHRDKELIFNH